MCFVSVCFSSPQIVGSFQAAVFIFLTLQIHWTYGHGMVRGLGDGGRWLGKAVSQEVGRMGDHVRGGSQGPEFKHKVLRLL